MPVQVTPVETMLRIRYQVGTDPNGNPIIDTDTYDDIKMTATDQQVFDVATAIAGLRNDPVVQVIRVDLKALAEV
jgi:hypothetical protein